MDDKLQNATGHQFTNDWFVRSAKNTWDLIVPQIKPSRILEIGSYEGASTCYLIDSLTGSGAIEIHCIDSWEGGVENKVGGVAVANMQSVETRFHYNTKLSISRAPNSVELVCHKGYSDAQLSKLIANGKANYFEFVYVDGSHQAPDVLCDAVLAFRLLKAGGILVFDDYLWAEPLPYGVDPVRCPKLAIDAFTNIYCRKLRVIQAPLYQLYVQKISD